MSTRPSGWSMPTATEVLLGLGALLLAGFAGYRLLMPSGFITIADRPRTSAAAPDFLVRYLDATSTDFRFDQGFVTLPASEPTKDRLRGLLSALGTYIDLLHEDRNLVLANRSSEELSERPLLFELRSAEPTEDGRLAISSHHVEWNDRTWAEFDQLILSLESQYREVAEALKSLDSGFIVPMKYTPAEPLGPGRAKMISKRRDGDSKKKVVELAPIELAEPPVPANQGRVLGN